MSRVNHKSLGMGTVTKREVIVNGKFVEVEYGGNYVTVNFDSGKELKFAIPASFDKGVLEPVGDFIDEVTCVSKEVERKILEGKPDFGISNGIRNVRQSDSRIKKAPAIIYITGDLKSDFKRYLELSGYEPSVVYAYLRYVGIVCREEEIGWKTLLFNIRNIIPLYSEGGAKESLGNYQNKTVINALKRYRDFADVNPDARVA